MPSFYLIKTKQPSASFHFVEGLFVVKFEKDVDLELYKFNPLAGISLGKREEYLKRPLFYPEGFKILEEIFTSGKPVFILNHSRCWKVLKSECERWGVEINEEVKKVLVNTKNFVEIKKFSYLPEREKLLQIAKEIKKSLDILESVHELGVPKIGRVFLLFDIPEEVVKDALERFKNGENIVVVFPPSKEIEYEAKKIEKKDKEERKDREEVKEEEVSKQTGEEERQLDENINSSVSPFDFEEEIAKISNFQSDIGPITLKEFHEELFFYTYLKILKQTNRGIVSVPSIGRKFRPEVAMTLFLLTPLYGFEFLLPQAFVEFTKNKRPVRYPDIPTLRRFIGELEKRNRIETRLLAEFLKGNPDTDLLKEIEEVYGKSYIGEIYKKLFTGFTIDEGSDKRVVSTFSEYKILIVGNLIHKLAPYPEKSDDQFEIDKGFLEGCLFEIATSPDITLSPSAKNVMAEMLSVLEKVAEEKKLDLKELVTEYKRRRFEVPFELGLLFKV